MRVTYKKPYRLVISASRYIAVREMKIYTVEHMVGIAGVDEKSIETHENIEAASASAAIIYVGGQTEPIVNNGSGRYNDYWMASEEIAATTAGERVAVSL